MSLNLNLRNQLGRKLTINELDDNFSNLENAINNGSSTQYEVKAHSSLTTDDIGKFVMSYTDPSWADWVINGGTISGFTGSISEARVVYLGGTSSGQNGKWTIDFAATYGTKDWNSLNDSDRFLEIYAKTNLNLSKYNLQFQELDPYLSPIIDSLTYSLMNDGYGTHSVTTDPTSLAILFEYYVNNGIPFDKYSADSRYSAKEPYFITQTYSTPFVSATRSGTSVQFEISSSTQNFNSIYYFGDKSSVEADVEIIPENNLPYLQYPVIGILEDLKDGMAYISPMPEMIEVAPTTGIYAGMQSDIITNIPISSNTFELSGFNLWFISGGGDLVNLGKYFDNQYILFTSLYNSPTYAPITTGMVGDKIVFKKVITFLN